MASALLLSSGPSHGDLASDLDAPGDAPQLRGFGVGGHFGRMPNWDIDKLLPFLKHAGVEYVRDEWGWEGVEKSKGVYAMPADGDHKFQVLHGAGLKILCALDYGNKLYANPLDPDAFANYAAWMAKTYKDDVTAWEIWNEPDNFYFYKQYGGHRDGSDDAIWNAKYSELVRKATAAIKAVDPTAIVLHNNEGTSWHYALEYHAADYAQTDGVDLHPYPTNPPKDGVEGRTPELDLNSNTWPTQYLGHRVQCWVGECGMSTYTPTDPKKVHFTPVTEPFQAACEIRTLVQGLVYGVKAWCIYDFVDESADPHDVESNFGLIRDYTHQYEPKPAFYALRRLARLLGPDWQSLDKFPAKLDVPSAASLKSGDSGSNPALIYWFRVKQSYVAIVWRAGGVKDFEADPALGTLRWPDAPSDLLPAEAVNLVTGKNVQLTESRHENEISVAKVPVGWAPVAIRWTIQEKP